MDTCLGPTGTRSREAVLGAVLEAAGFPVGFGGIVLPIDENDDCGMVAFNFQVQIGD